MFSAISLFMKQKMRDRVKLIKPEQLSEFIPLENVPADFTPDGQLEFDYQAWVLQQFAKEGIEPSDSVKQNLAETTKQQSTKSKKK